MHHLACVCIHIQSHSMCFDSQVKGEHQGEHNLFRDHVFGGRRA